MSVPVPSRHRLPRTRPYYTPTPRGRSMLAECVNNGGKVDGSGFTYRYWVAKALQRAGMVRILESSKRNTWSAYLTRKGMREMGER